METEKSGPFDPYIPVSRDDDGANLVQRLKNTLELQKLKFIDRREKKDRIRLFDDKSNKLLTININIPITTCNYRCDYCYLSHQIKPDVSKLVHLDKIFDRLKLIPRPLGMQFMPHGDITAVKEMWPYFAKLAALKNVMWIETFSNMSRDLEGLLEYCPPNKLHLVATYHPTQFRIMDRDKQAFFTRVAKAKKVVRDISVNFVMCEENMPFLPELKARLQELNVYLSFNPQIMVVNGYQKPIKPVEGELLEAVRRQIDNPLLSSFILDNKRMNIRCTAGKDLLDIYWSGEVSRCEQFAGGSKSPLGNIFDPEGPWMEKHNRYCETGGCACKSTVLYTVPLVNEYKRIGTQHHIVKREPEDTGKHAYDPIENFTDC